MWVGIGLVGFYALLFLLKILLRLLIWWKVGDREKSGKLSHRYKDYQGEEHIWEPTTKLKHIGLRTFNLPFTPIPTEVFYIENEYDEAANRFVIEHMDEIRELFGRKGLTFVYLPHVIVTPEMALSMLEYHTPQGCSAHEEVAGGIHGVASNFIVDYLVNPKSRKVVKSAFAWHNPNADVYAMRGRKVFRVFDIITFDGEEALANPQGVLDELFVEIGESKIWYSGLYCMADSESVEELDETIDEATEKILSDIQEKLDAIRLRGISEAVIAKYVSPHPTISRLIVTNDLRIILSDYNDMEIKMEPLVKAVFLLFLRHPEGIILKDIADHKTELEIIYRAIRQHRNDIRQRMAQHLLPPKISTGIDNLTAPFSNSLNEKCARVKEAFVTRFHESIAQNYYIHGVRGMEYSIFLPAEKIIWEEDER